MGEVTSESTAGGLLSITASATGVAAIGVVFRDPNGRMTGPYTLAVTVGESIPNA
jgi:hypothetical protein